MAAANVILEAHSPADRAPQASTEKPSRREYYWEWCKRSWNIFRGVPAIVSGAGAVLGVIGQFAPIAIEARILLWLSGGVLVLAAFLAAVFLPPFDMHEKQWRELSELRDSLNDQAERWQDEFNEYRNSAVVPFSRLLASAYEAFKPTQGTILTKWEDLAAAAKWPSPFPGGGTAAAWIQMHGATNHKETAQLLRFVQRIYDPQHADIYHHSILSNGDLRNFHNLRRRIKESYTKWGDRLGRTAAFQRFADDRIASHSYIIKLAAYLECAVAQALRLPDQPALRDDGWVRLVNYVAQRQQPSA